MDVTYTVIIMLTLLVLWFIYNQNREKFDVVKGDDYIEPDHTRETWPNYDPSVDMIDFRAEDPKLAKYTRNWDRDEWGLDSSEKYYENLTYYNQGLSAYDPHGESMFDDPAGSPPLPGMSEVERLGYEVLGDQAAAADPTQIRKFRFRAENEGSASELMAGNED